MAFIIRDKTTNSTIRTIAYDIITTQQQQAGQMYGWLAQWRLHQTGSEPPMAWMGSGHHMGSPASTGSTMPGMGDGMRGTSARTPAPALCNGGLGAWPPALAFLNPRAYNHGGLL